MLFILALKFRLYLPGQNKKKTVTSLSLVNHCSNGYIHRYSSDFRIVFDTYELPSIDSDSIVSQSYVFYATCRDLTHGLKKKGIKWSPSLYVGKSWDMVKYVFYFLL